MNSTLPSSIAQAISPSDDAADAFETFVDHTVLIVAVVIFLLSLLYIYIHRRFLDREPSVSFSFPGHQPPSSDSNGGLDISTVNSLPLVACTKARTHPMIDEYCSICLTEFRERETVRLIPNCGHMFHPRCIGTWLRSHATCPLCRSAQLFKSGEEVRLDVEQLEKDVGPNAVHGRSTLEIQ